MKKVRGTSNTIQARRPLALVLATAGLLAAGSTGWAAPITSDVTIGGSVELSTSIGVSPFSDGAVTQSGEIRTTSGGSTTNAAFSTSPGTADGVDDGTTTLPSPNPLTGGLTDTGDGIGWSTDLTALFETGFDFNEGYDFIIGFSIDLNNSSLVDTYTVTVQVDFSHSADADGADAYGVLGLDIELDNVDVRTSDITSDALLGDELNGTFPGTAGDLIADSGIFDIVVVLNPGGSASIGGTHQWEGGVFDPDLGLSLILANVDLTILSVACTGGPCGETPQPAPAPGTLALLGLALPGLTLFRRRRIGR